VVSKTAAAIAWRSGGAATLDLAPLAIFSMGKMMGKLDENLLEVGILMDNCCFFETKPYIYMYMPLIIIIYSRVKIQKDVKTMGKAIRKMTYGQGGETHIDPVSGWLATGWVLMASN
jgi:hypothetical protein